MNWRLVRARGSEAAPDSVRRFASRARRRRLRAAVPWLITLGMVVVMALMAGVVWFTAAFGVERITVNGTAVATASQVRDAAAIASGTPLARVNTSAVAERVGQVVPAVLSAVVTRDWPRTIVIDITERTGFAAVPVSDDTEFIIVDDSGVCFDTAAERPADLPVVRVDSPSEDDPTTEAALTVLASLPEELLSLMSELVAEAPARIRLELADGREIVWGDATENDAKARVALVLLERPGTVLDVSAPNLVTVR